jgi:hypothetical protein
MANNSKRKMRKKAASRKEQVGSGNSTWAVARNVQRAGNNRYSVFSTILSYPIGGIVLQGNALGQVFGANAITVSSLSNSSNYLAVFDSYRVDKVEYTFSLRNAGTGAGGFGNQFPTIYLFPDWDDSATPTSLSYAASHPRATRHVLTPNRPSAQMSIEPKVAVAAYNGVFTGYGQPTGPMWIDSGSPNVAHYGIKWAVGYFLDTTQYIDVSIKAWVSFREPI